MRTLILSAVLALSAPVLASAQSFQAINKLNVISIDRTTFEVIEGRGEGARGTWCAAAEYADRRLGAQGRIYVSEARGASRAVAGRKSVVFTTNAAALKEGPSQSASVSTSQVGLGLRVAHAIQFCRRGADRSGRS